MYVFTKNDGPRNEDVAAKQMIEKNWGTIDRLANQISGGRWQDIKQARAAKTSVAEYDRKSFVGYVPTARREAMQPYIRISLNNRVVVVDGDTNRQVLFLGEIRYRPHGRVFCLATRANGFFDPAADEVLEALADLDGCVLDASEGDEPFKQELAHRLGFAEPRTA
ncbi:hypothetical protein [Ancylobacter lacus]|uniref:hypothetical protein n=1 Tax=Ancylobacter lacus TaxID=2579970 RepID=UPI001BCED6F6|nr:hypothetical protein [Ancylobacter lacus]MBS7537556.1 hypothetical protein [Ancylobacter lacus]